MEEKKQLIFVGGMHRSGTTLLAELIGRIEGASSLDGTGVPENEGQHLQSVYPSARGRVDSWVRLEGAHLTEDDCGAGTPERLLAAWAPFWDQEATVWVEKSPPNITKMRFLQSAFPQAKFVVATRHPVVQALAVRKWAARTSGRYGVGFDRLIRHWVDVHDVFAADAPYVRHLHVVRYEHLVEDPQRELSRLSQFLELDLPADHGVSTARSGRYEETWVGDGAHTTGRRLIRAARDFPAGPRRAARDLVTAAADAFALPRTRHLLERELGGRIAGHGYLPGDLHHAAPWFRQLSDDAR